MRESDSFARAAASFARELAFAARVRKAIEPSVTEDASLLSAEAQPPTEKVLFIERADLREDGPFPKRSSVIIYAHPGQLSATGGMYEIASSQTVVALDRHEAERYIPPQTLFVRNEAIERKRPIKRYGRRGEASSEVLVKIQVQNEAGKLMSEVKKTEEIDNMSK